MELRFHIYVFDFQVIFITRISLIEKEEILHNNKHETALQETVIDILQGIICTMLVPSFSAVRHFRCQSH